MSGTQTGTLADLREALATRQAATAAQGGTAASDHADLPKREPKRDAFGRSSASWPFLRPDQVSDPSGKARRRGRQLFRAVRRRCC